MPDGLADRWLPLAEDAVGALADVLSGDAGQLGLAHRQGEQQAAVGAGLRPGAEVDQVVPVERGEEERGGHGRFAEISVGLALGVEVRHLVLAHQRRHALVGERHPSAGVLQRRRDDVLHSRPPRRRRHVARLRLLALGGKVLPEVGDEVGAVRAGERPGEARLIVEIGGDDLRAGARERDRLVGSGVAGQGPGRETALRIVEDGPHEAVALRAGGADDGDDFVLRHGPAPFWLGRGMTVIPRARASLRLPLPRASAAMRRGELETTRPAADREPVSRRRAAPAATAAPPGPPARPRPSAAAGPSPVCASRPARWCWRPWRAGS